VAEPAISTKRRRRRRARPLLRYAAARRQRIEVIVTYLIDLLDIIDGDPDLESSIDLNRPDYAVDAEGEDDNGIGDAGGAAEQYYYTL
jgi:hypothetical protein